MSKKKLNNPKCNRSKGNRSKGNRSKGNRSRKIKVSNYTKKRCKKHNSQKGGALRPDFETKFQELVNLQDISGAIALGNKEYMDHPENKEEIVNLMATHYERLAQTLHNGADLKVFGATVNAVGTNMVREKGQQEAMGALSNIASYQTNKIVGTLNSLKDTSLLDLDMMRDKTMQDGITNLKDIIGLQEGENGINKLRNIIGLQEGENVMNMLGISSDENAMNKLEQISSTVSNNLVAKISSGILAGCLPEVEDGINKKVNDLAIAYSIPPLKGATVADKVADRARIINDIHTKQNDHIQVVNKTKIGVNNTETDRQKRSRVKAGHAARKDAALKDAALKAAALKDAALKAAALKGAS